MIENISEKAIQSLLEAHGKDWMSPKERKLKRKLINLLKDDGKGHHHALYAKRLAEYDINIVPLGKEPSTAAISFDEGVIYINTGFLRDPDTFEQLNVIMRHELCHNLLLHQIRMIKHISEVPESHLRLSSSIHNMLNIIEDFEISNKAYTDADKAVIRELWLNGKKISGLVTEDHRQSWLDLPLEDMYDALVNEYEMHGNTGELDDTHNAKTVSGTLNHSAQRVHSYKGLIGKHSNYYSADELYRSILGPAYKKDPNIKMPDEWQEIFDGLKPLENGYSAEEIDAVEAPLKDSRAIEKCDLKDPKTGKTLCTVYTPEEKSIALEILNLYAGRDAYSVDYRTWYEEIIKQMAGDEFTDDELKDIFSALN